MSTAPPGAPTRATAARAIDGVVHEGRSLKAVLAQMHDEVPDPRDRALVEAIAFQALRHLRRYRFTLAAWMDKPLPAREHVVEALLLAGLAQLDALALPAHAAVSATAEAARLLRKPAFVGLVNALLRRSAREAWPLSADPAIVHSYPDWLAARLRADWPEAGDELLAAGNRVAPLWLRVNVRKGDRASYLQRLQAQEIACVAPASPGAALRVDAGAVPHALPGWDEGEISVQDGAAQLASEALAPRAGERVLDLCCAPGGKSAAILEAADVELTAIDVEPQRLARVDAGLRRVGLRDRARLIAADAGDTAAWWDGTPFDAVLLDAPCSGTGVIRRQPDIKWHRRQADLVALAATQRRLLDAAWHVLRPGGRLLYATCSILRAENSEAVAAFLVEHPDAVEVPLDERFGRAALPGRQRLPGEDGMDGFYYALLNKSAALA